MPKDNIQRSYPLQGAFAPQNLLMAGVSAKDVVWYLRLKGGDKTAELKLSDRGRAIVEKVHAYELRRMKASTGAMPAMA